VTAAPHSDRSAPVRPRVSRAPVWLLIGGLALAVGLVLIGARLAAAPALVPDLSSPGTPDQPRSVNVIMRDYAFNPTPLYLVAGETVQLELINAGLIVHELVLGDAEVQRAWALADALATPPGLLATPPPASVPPGIGGLRVVLAPGATARLRYEVPAGQALQLMCHLPGHVERGMVGAVDVVYRGVPLDAPGT
jgi:uncharacterized cupredoxin-like copper-binding protein